MALPIDPTPQDRKEREARAKEFRQFRRNFRYSQTNLAAALKCSRRTIVSVESGDEVVRPRRGLLQRFDALKAKVEAQLRAIERRTKVA
jgi:DNA-binding XRE family transcriptional regulator